VKGGELVLHPLCGCIDALLADVADHDGHFQSPHDFESKLARHEATADHAYFVDREGEFLIGRPRRQLLAFLDEHERIHAGPELITGNQFGKCSILGGEALCFARRFSRQQEVQGDIGSKCDGSQFFP